MSAANKTCINCEQVVVPGSRYVCDLDMDPRAQWCPDCFEKTACGQGVHGEDCPTLILDDAA